VSTDLGPAASAAAGAAPNPSPSDGKDGFDWPHFLRTYAIIGILLAFIVVLTILTKGTFSQPENLINVVRQVAAIGVIAIGMTFVIITLGIDLSVGSILALAAVVATSLAQKPSDRMMYTCRSSSPSSAGSPSARPPDSPTACSSPSSGSRPSSPPWA
jgi:ribose/xylose/arabinose/galactoside ABC-type transport system permease subunit